MHKPVHFIHTFEKPSNEKSSIYHEKDVRVHIPCVQQKCIHVEKAIFFPEQNIGACKLNFIATFAKFVRIVRSTESKHLMH